MDRRGSILVIFLALCKPDSMILGLRLVELRVPAHAPAGGEALLGCQFEIENDLLYSLKWYKDGREFYRYVPKNKNPVSHFPAPGVYVDMARSSSDVVTLVNLKRESAGVYRCEVSGEAPLFTTVAHEKYVTIHVLPDTGPTVSGLKDHYMIGDRIAANCTSSASRPEAQLKWLINERSTPRTYLQGPWYRISNPADTTETILQIRFQAKPFHFRDGVLELKCQATIAPLYQQETVHVITYPVITVATMEPMSPVDEGGKANSIFGFPLTSAQKEPPETHSPDAKGDAVLIEKYPALISVGLLLLLRVI